MLDMAGYSNRAGRASNCDSLIWRERDFGAAAALCSAQKERADIIGAARLASLRLLELAGEVRCADDADQTVRGVMKEICTDGFPDAVFDAALLMVREGRAIWAGAGSARLYVFADGSMRRFGASPDITSAETEFAPGDALLLGSGGFCRDVPGFECGIDLCKSKDAARWMEYLTLRNIERSQFSGDSVSVLLCISGE